MAVPDESSPGTAVPLNSHFLPRLVKVCGAMLAQAGPIPPFEPWGWSGRRLDFIASAAVRPAPRLGRDFPRQGG
jgi:hypothetical protein